MFIALRLSGEIRVYGSLGEQHRGRNESEERNNCKKDSILIDCEEMSEKKCDAYTPLRLHSVG